MASSLVAIPFNRLSAYNSGGLDAYLREISSIPILDAEEERRLARRFREKGDIEAVQKLIMANLRFVVHIARTTALRVWPCPIWCRKAISAS